MKARYQMRCECCQAVIEVGSRYVMFHGRPWLSTHVIKYQSERRGIAASATPKN